MCSGHDSAPCPPGGGLPLRADALAAGAGGRAGSALGAVAGGGAPAGAPGASRQNGNDGGTAM